MFTGIIESQAVLKERKEFPKQSRLTFEVLGKTSPFHIGESVAVDGVCVTVIKSRAKKFSVDLIPETLLTTTLRNLTPGGRVNFERSLKVGDRLGGHVVSGHVDGTGVIKKITRRDRNFLFEIETSPNLLRQLVIKGSVAVDGISFTVQGIKGRRFVLGVTPHTYRATTLQWKKEGDRVNLEIDFFAKLVQHFLSSRGNGLKVKDLRQQGF